MKLTHMQHQQAGSIPAPGKSFKWIDGKLEKDVEGSYVHLLATTVETDLKGLVKLIGSIDANSHFVAGISTLSPVNVMPAGSVAPPDTVVMPRTNESFPFAPGTPGLMVIDSDGLGGPAVWQQIATACPSLAGHARVEASSSSSNLYAPDDTRLSGEKGQHTYLHVADASDIPRALTVLHRRLVLSGHAAYKVSKTGDILERTAVDQQLGVPSQPIYLHPSLYGGITQKKRVEMFKGNEVVDTRACIPDLTPEEQQLFLRMDAEARATLKVEADAVAAAYDEYRGKALPGGAAEARAARRNSRLPTAWEITLATGEKVTVGTILADPEAYHGKPCRDPLEPDYGSRSVAKIYTMQDAPMINSQAHGGRFFHLGEPIAQDVSGLPWDKNEEEDAPRDIVTEYIRLPFPVACLPATVAMACIDVQYQTHAPMALVAASALTAMSIAFMGHFNAVRGPRLKGPCSLIIMSIAASSERKTTVDGWFTDAIQKYEIGAKISHDLKMILWNQRNDNREAILMVLTKELRSALEDEAKDPPPPNEVKASESAQKALDEFIKKNPKEKKPALPRLLYDMMTQEKMTSALSTYPLMAWVSDEGGTFAGSRAMNKESVVATLAAINKAYGGNKLQKDIKSEDSETCLTPRLTMHIAIQPGLFKQMIGANGGTMRDIGTVSRMLLCAPETTRGTRFLENRAEGGTLGIDSFNQRISKVLTKPIQIDKATGELITVPVPMEPDARLVWVRFHDHVEKKLGPDGVYAELSDMAGKMAENAARLATLFACHEDQPTVSASVMRNACSIAQWYLNESLSMFGLEAESEPVRDAVAVESWIIKRCVDEKKDFVTMNELSQNISSRALRKLKGKARRDVAVGLLIKRNRLMYVNVVPNTIRLFPLPDLLADARIKSV